MVVVCTEGGHVERAGRDDQSVGGINGTDPDSAKFGAKVAQPIALLVADEPDAVNLGGSFSKCRDRRQGRNEITDVGHVDGEAAQWARSCNRRTSLILHHRAPHAREYLAEGGVTLDRMIGQSRNARAPTANGC